MHSFFDKKTVAGSHRFLTELLLELYVVSDGAFAARTVRQALQHGADLPLGGFDLGMERAGGDAQRPWPRMMTCSGPSDVATRTRRSRRSS